MKWKYPVAVLWIALLLLKLPLYSQDWQSLHLKARFDTLNEAVIGEAWQHVTQCKALDTLVLDAVRIQIDSLSINGQTPNFRQNDTAVFIPLTAGEDSIILYIAYQALPRKGIYFIGWQDSTRRSRRQIWTQGQGIDHRHWIPHRDDQTDKILFSAEWIFNEDYQAMSNGILDSVVSQDGENHWFYHMDQPMSSYLIALALGKYVTSSQMVKGTPHLLYHYPERIQDSAWYYYRHHRVAQFLENEINYNYPWPNYKQAPVRDFRHGAMENTCATIFGDFFLVDSVAFNDRNYTYVDAHEFAHQWFGNLVTAAGSEHHWLHEGFATYYQWLSEKELYGQDRFDWELQKAKDLVFEASQRDSFPLAHPKAGVERFYQKGGWLLYMLRDYVGDSIYRKVIDEYLHTYAYKVVRNEDLIRLFEKHSDKDIDGFFATWLYADREPEVAIRKSPVSQELIIDVDLAFPQPLQIGFYIGKGWTHIQDFVLVQGRNRIPMPDSIAFYYVANASDLLIKVNSEYSWPDLKRVFETDNNPWHRQRYLDQWPETEEANAYLSSIIRNPGELSPYNLGLAVAMHVKRNRNQEEALSALCDSLLRHTDHVEVQEQLLKVASSNIRSISLDQGILDSLSMYARSYKVRELALLLGKKDKEYLSQDFWRDNPGIVGKQVYITALSTIWLFYKDEAVHDTLLDLAGPSFDFNTRMYALGVVSYRAEDREDLWQVLFEAFQDKNWKLSKLSREKLILLRRQYPESFERNYKMAKRNWDDFQKRKAARTFETD